ncbi:hypothetical protein BAE44_0002224 [Dichanthelium oligosanthes]|uniref:Uncharacterized protein n=1 Tax=Dichanthelium oligosanthes TaxID=888268 RepID=A0A1E5WH90_9POAL|nr:hypothetical protein BAE44_0002224 [Dichanthelium oligosanthes]
MEHQGQHVHATTGVEGYGNPVAAQEHGGDATGMAGAGGQVQPAAEEHRSRGILHRSGSSSSSSSSEDDGMGGRRKKGLKEKIKEKLPGGHKDNQQSQATAAGGAYGQAAGHAGAAAGHGTDGTGEGEKKGLMDKIKEKLPGHH